MQEAWSKSLDSGLSVVVVAEGRGIRKTFIGRSRQGRVKGESKVKSRSWVLMYLPERRVPSANDNVSGGSSAGKRVRRLDYEDRGIRMQAG